MKMAAPIENDGVCAPGNIRHSGHGNAIVRYRAAGYCATSDNTLRSPMAMNPYSWQRAINSHSDRQESNMNAIQKLRDLLASFEWVKLAHAGARPQRLLWASTGTKDPDVPHTLCAETLAAPDTINTLPEKTLKALAGHGNVHDEVPADGGDAEAVLAEFAHAGIDEAALAAELQQAGTRSFDKSWNDLMDCLAARSATLQQTAQAKGK